MQHLSYLFDPLCGWCYGASPALTKLLALEKFTVELVPTGLFAGKGAFAMNSGFAAHAWEADQRIAKLSGQLFTEAYRKNVLENRESRVDSGPATLALTAVRLTTSGREFEVLNAIQQARYVEGRDNGDPAVITGVLTGLGLAAAAERFAAPDDALLSANDARIADGQAEMRRFGGRGVPTLIAEIDGTRAIVDSSVLYGGTETLIAALRAA